MTRSLRALLKKRFLQTGDQRFSDAIEALDEGQKGAGRPVKRRDQALLSVWQVVQWELYSTRQRNVSAACRSLANGRYFFIGPEGATTIPNWQTMRQWYYEAGRLIRSRKK